MFSRSSTLLAHLAAPQPTSTDFSPLLKAVISFTHPVLMLGALIATFYALYLGLLARQTRSADAETRKQMIKQKYNQRHFQLGALLLAVWVIGAVAGMGATYLLYGKLFVSPHLLIGLSTICFASLAATLVPLMQQGKEWARLLHIALATLVVGCFLAQTVTGLQVVQKMIDEMLKTA
jgi:flagellar biosynthesis protein FlhB